MVASSLLLLIAQLQGPDKAVAPFNAAAYLGQPLAKVMPRVIF